MADDAGHTRAQSDDRNSHAGREDAPTDKGDDAPPENPFGLLMSLIWKLPRWSHVPISVAILAPLVWIGIPDSIRAALVARVTADKSGTALFPSVEHELADYTIELNPTGGATWLLKFKFRKLRQEATRLADTIATSATLSSVHSETHDIHYTKDPFNPPKQPNLSRYVVTLDISKDQPDEVRDAIIRYEVSGGFTGVRSEWVGVLSLQPTRKAIVHLLFQPAKIGRNFRFSAYEWSVAPDDAESLADQKFNFVPDTRTLNWEIEHPLLNYVYRVDWDW